MCFTLCNIFLIIFQKEVDRALQHPRINVKPIPDNFEVPKHIHNIPKIKVIPTPKEIDKEKYDFERTNKLTSQLLNIKVSDSKKYSNSDVEDYEEAPTGDISNDGDIVKSKSVKGISIKKVVVKSSSNSFSTAHSSEDEKMEKLQKGVEDAIGSANYNEIYHYAVNEVRFFLF